MKDRAPLLTLTLLALGAVLAEGQSPAASADWPSYNRTLTSERFAALSQINAGNVARLKVLCTYDTGRMVSFQSGLIQVDGQLIGTTTKEIFSLNPNTCHENWRTFEDYVPANTLNVNRGAGYLAGRLFRGTQDGRVLAYDAKTGRRLWATQIADPRQTETVPAAPIAWNGLVFIGNAGGDNKGVKGRVYALDAADGHIVWETYLVPKSAGDPTRGPNAPLPPKLAASWSNAADVPITGGGNWTSYSLDPRAGTLYVPGGNPAPDFARALRPGVNLFTGSVVALDARTGSYRADYPMVKEDFHDWDVSGAPTLITSRAGRHLLIGAPKDGQLYGFDRASGQQLYQTAVTTVLNPTVPLTASGTRFCPGSQGGAEWNGPAYDPQTNLVLTGEVDWCWTVKLAPDAKIKSVAEGQPWTGNDSDDPARGFGFADSTDRWSGRFTATDADTGQVRWRFRTPTPILSGVTPTGGGVVFFGDMGGTLYALDSARGKALWSRKIGGAIGGGVITYDSGAGQRVAVATGMTSSIWPTEKTTAKVVVLGLR